MAYSEFRFFSPLRDAEMMRVSMPDERGQEYFCIIPAADGRKYRERRDEALDMITTAIRQGLPPGEVVPA